jgi:hypothetical protein
MTQTGGLKLVSARAFTTRLRNQETLLIARGQSYIHLKIRTDPALVGAFAGPLK